MRRDPGPAQERTAALLERAYRMALVLQGRLCEGDEATAGSFEAGAVARELVALLDDARAAWLGADPALSYSPMAPAPADNPRASPQDAGTACTGHAPSARRP